MKLIKYSIVAATLVAFTSCGVSNRHDDIKDLKDSDGEWTEKETNKAIDIYIEGRSEKCSMVEDMFLIEEKLNLEGDWKIKAKKSSYWKDRKDEIKEAEKRAKELSKELKKKYSDEED